MKGMRAQHRRRALAAMTCLLWILGVEVLPALHLALHDTATHEHAPSGMIVTVTFGATTHAHDGTVHAHDAADHAAKLTRTERSPRRDQLAIDEPRSGHVASGLAHRATALHAPPPPLLAPLPVVRLVTNVIASPAGRVAVAFVATADARGPPAA